MKKKKDNQPYRLRRLADAVWEEAKLLESPDLATRTHVETELKSISTRLHGLAAQITPHSRKG